MLKGVLKERRMIRFLIVADPVNPKVGTRDRWSFHTSKDTMSKGVGKKVLAKKSVSWY